MKKLLPCLALSVLGAGLLQLVKPEAEAQEARGMPPGTANVSEFWTIHDTFPGVRAFSVGAGYRITMTGSAMRVSKENMEAFYVPLSNVSHYRLK